MKNFYLYLAPQIKNTPLSILDCTFGRGGHSLAFLEKQPESSVLALDRDLTAIQSAASLKQARLKLLHQNFYEFPYQIDKHASFDLILMDLGVSSPQLDEGERGFSFNKPGPLDMRMDQTQKLKADIILNSFNKKELIDLFQTYGEIKYPYSVVNDLIQRRKKKKFETTEEFVEIIQKYHSSVRHRHHPATKWFLALRIAVNQELGGFKKVSSSLSSFFKARSFFSCHLFSLFRRSDCETKFS